MLVPSFITPFDIAIVVLLSTIAGVLMCEAYHLMSLEGYLDD